MKKCVLCIFTLLREITGIVYSMLKNVSPKTHVSAIVYNPIQFTGISLLTFEPIPLRADNLIQLTFQTLQVSVIPGD